MFLLYNVLLLLTNNALILHTQSTLFYKHTTNIPAASEWLELLDNFRPIHIWLKKRTSTSWLTHTHSSLLAGLPFCMEFLPVYRRWSGLNALWSHSCDSAQFWRFIKPAACTDLAIWLTSCHQNHKQYPQRMFLSQLLVQTLLRSDLLSLKLKAGSTALILLKSHSCDTLKPTAFYLLLYTLTNIIEHTTNVPCLYITTTVCSWYWMIHTHFI